MERCPRPYLRKKVVLGFIPSPMPRVEKIRRFAHRESLAPRCCGCLHEYRAVDETCKFRTRRVRAVEYDNGCRVAPNRVGRNRVGSILAFPAGEVEWMPDRGLSGTQRLERQPANPTPVDRIARTLARRPRIPVCRREVGCEEVIGWDDGGRQDGGELRRDGGLPASAPSVNRNDERRAVRPEHVLEMSAKRVDHRIAAHVRVVTMQVPSLVRQVVGMAPNEV